MPIRALEWDRELLGPAAPAPMPPDPTLGGPADLGRRHPLPYRLPPAGLDDQVLWPVELAQLSAEPVRGGLVQPLGDVLGPAGDTGIDSRQEEGVPRGVWESSFVTRKVGFAWRHMKQYRHIAIV